MLKCLPIEATRKHWRNNGVDIEWNDSDNDEAYSWTPEVEYVMTENGLERTGKYIDKEETPERNEIPERKEIPEKKEDNQNGDYRYHKQKTTKSQTTPSSEDNDDDKDSESGESSATLVLLTNLS